MPAAAWPLLACTVAVFAGGGYGAGGRIAFVAAALAAVVAIRPRVVREPAVLVLAALAVLGTASAAWTVGLVGEALRWGLVTGAYAALVVVGAHVAREPGGAERRAVGLAALAVGAGALGLVSAALSDGTFAVDRLGGWRPGGPFEYPPALALAQVGALPVLIRYRSRIGLAVAIAVLVLAESRTALGLAFVVTAIYLPRPRLVLAGGLAAALLIAVPASGSDFLHGRAGTWEAAVQTFADRPVTGAGADGFLSASVRHQDGDTIAFAHQLPLELAAELGIAGFLLVVALYGAVGRLLWRARATTAAYLLGPLVAAFLVSNLLDWTWHLAGSGAMWAVALGAIAQGTGKVTKVSVIRPMRPAS